jgi:uncharacterized protein
MMDVTPFVPQDKKVITGYGESAFTVNEHEIEGHIWIMAEEVEPFSVSSDEIVTFEDVAPLLEKYGDKVDVLLIGCGEVHQLLPASFQRDVRRFSVSVEVMTTGAACRTYNVLLSEGRNVAAAMLAV